MEKSMVKPVLKKYRIKYVIAGQESWFMISAENEKEAEKMFLKCAKGFYGKNEMFAEFGFYIDWSSVVLKVETF